MPYSDPKHLTTPLVHIPGSKSLTNRALLLAALAQGTSHVNNVLESDDTRVMKAALHELGISIEPGAERNAWIVRGQAHWKKPNIPLHLGNAGTAVRFLTAILSHQPFETTLDGDARMRERPLQDLLDALRSLGAKIETPNDCPPLTLHGHPLEGGQTELNAENSSQYGSALLMLAPLLHKGLTLNLVGNITSKPYLDLTLDLMNKFCVQIERPTDKTYHIPQQLYRATDLTIEGDASAATYFFGLAAITGTTLLVSPLSRKTRQPDIQLLDHLEAMGCTATQIDEKTITLTGPETLKPLGSIDANDFPDGAMTLAVVAAFAQGTTHLNGLHNLRIKESDRLHALTTELKKINATVVEHENGLTIHGNPKTLRDLDERQNPISIKTYNDHRMAMCFGMAKSRLPHLIIQNPDCVNKTYPEFWNHLAQVNPKLTPA